MTTPVSNDAVSYLAKSFRAGVALRAALDSTFEKFGCLAWGTPEAQKQLLSETVFYTTGLPQDKMRFPFGTGRCKRFVRLLMDEIDRIPDFELDEDVAEHAAAFCQTRGGDDELSYVIYELAGGVTLRTRNVVIRMSGRFNELGYRVWESGLFLCNELMDKESRVRKLLEGRRVLEIGAGTGVTAAGYAEAGVEYALMTDYTEDVVRNMGYNIEQNCGKGRVECGVLDAANGDEVMRIVNEKGIDIMVAADVTYDEDMVMWAVNGFRRVVGGERVGVMVVTERSEKMMELLWQTLEEAGLRAEKVACGGMPKSVSYLVGWDFSRVHVYQVTGGVGEGDG